MEWYMKECIDSISKWCGKRLKQTQRRVWKKGKKERGCFPWVQGGVATRPGWGGEVEGAEGGKKINSVRERRGRESNGKKKI